MPTKNTFPEQTFELLETLLWESGEYFLLDRHLERIMHSAASLGFAFSVEQLRSSLSDAEQSFEQHVSYRVRLTINSHGSVSLTSVIQPETTPATVVFADTPVDSNDLFLRHKTTHRKLYEQHQAIHPHADDVLLWNERGELTESCIANIALKRHGQWITPPLSCGLLPGTFRAQLVHDGVLTEEIIRRDSITADDTLFLINSVRKWRPVDKIILPW